MLSASDIVDLARSLLNEHGLVEWHVELSRGKRTYGECHHDIKTIRLSQPGLSINDRATAREVILHEISHALVGPGHGHGPVWQKQARQMAIPAVPFVLPEHRIPPKWIIRCGTCHTLVGRRDRLSKKFFARRRSNCCWAELYAVEYSQIDTAKEGK